jgi:hypothetical protein
MGIFRLLVGWPLLHLLRKVWLSSRPFISQESKIGLLSLSGLQFPELRMMKTVTVDAVSDDAYKKLGFYWYK